MIFVVKLQHDNAIRKQLLLENKILFRKLGEFAIVVDEFKAEFVRNILDHHKVEYKTPEKCDKPLINYYHCSLMVNAKLVDNNLAKWEKSMRNGTDKLSNSLPKNIAIKYVGNENHNGVLTKLKFNVSSTETKEDLQPYIDKKLNQLTRKRLRNHNYRRPYSGIKQK